MKRYAMALALSALLAACGGGASSTGADTAGAARLSAASALANALAPAPAASDVMDARSDYEKLLEAAEAQRSQAQALVVDAPCQTHAQCGALAFQEYGPCRTQSYQPYLLTSATAEAAQAAMAEYNDLVGQALEIAPVSNEPIMCIMSVVISTPQCISNQCVDTHGVVGGEAVAVAGG
jgi:hypothetical protein